MRINPRAVWFLFLSFFAAYLLLRSHVLFGEIVHDDGLFLYGAQAWAAGETPYRDFWDHKPPGVFLFNSIPLHFFPFSLIAVRLHQCFWLAWSAVFLFLVCNRFFQKPVSFFTVALYILFTSMRYTVQSGGLTEEGALLFVTSAYWFALRDSGKVWLNTLISGILLGIAIQFRQTFVFESLFVAGVLWHLHKKESVLAFIQQLLLLSAGMALPEAAFSCYFWLHGCWWDYFEASYLFNFYYVGPGRSPVSFNEFFQKQWVFILNTGPYLLAPAFALLSYRLTAAPYRWLLLPALLTFAGDLISVSLSGEYYGHYYVQCAVSSSLLLAFSLSGIYTSFFDGGGAIRKVSSGILAATCLLFCVTGINRYYKDYRYTVGKSMEDESTRSFQFNVAQAVRRLTYHIDRILLIGHEPNSVYFLAGRYSGSRFYHFAPLWKDKLQNAVTQRHHAAFLEDLKTRKPLLLLLDLKRLPGDGALSRVAQYCPEAVAYIEDNYIPLEEAIPAFPDEWSWYDIRLQILVLNQGKSVEFVQELYKWDGENPDVGDMSQYFRSEKNKL